MYIIAIAIISILLPSMSTSNNYQHIRYPEYGEDLGTHSYCGRRTGEQCCAGRDDYCTVPILDTVCYCDIFCNRTVADCCPDFWQLCIGIRPPPGAWTPPPLIKLKNNCVHEGVVHQLGSTITVNCNNCTCEEFDGKEYNWKCTQKICLIREEIIQSVNTGNNGWFASNYSFLWSKTLDEGLKYRLGTFKPTAPVDRMSSIRVNVEERLPDYFDARRKWPGLIHDVMDQGDCGASWAMSTAAVASDRLSIHTHGMMREEMSPQHILSCDYQNQQGCNGGYVDRAWWFLRRTGVVSDDCYPYKSGETGAKGMCQVRHRYYHTSGTKVMCPATRSRSSIYQSSPPYRISNNENEIMKEIMENGPVQAIMEVKEDFFMYNRGVYHYAVDDSVMNQNHRKSGHHSVKIIGWGTDHTGGRPRKYWLCANSWGTQWGENGYFKIQRGVNEGNIEDFIVGAWAKVNGRQIIARFHERTTPTHDGAMDITESHEGTNPIHDNDEHNSGNEIDGSGDVEPNFSQFGEVPLIGPHT